MKIKFTLALLLVSMLIGCAKTKIKYATPSWRGITPGATTEEQVRSILGAPDEVGELDGHYYYEYRIQDLSSTTHYNRIYFQPHFLGDQIVEWMDIENGVDVSHPYTISNAIEEYQIPLDVISMRLKGDVTELGLIYMWAYEGVAMAGVSPKGFPLELSDKQREQCETAPPLMWVHTFTINPGVMMSLHEDPCDIVIRTVFFVPTDYEKAWQRFVETMPKLDGNLNRYIHEDN